MMRTFAAVSQYLGGEDEILKNQHRGVATGKACVAVFEHARQNAVGRRGPQAIACQADFDRRLRPASLSTLCLIQYAIPVRLSPEKALEYCSFSTISIKPQTDAIHSLPLSGNLIGLRKYLASHLWSLPTSASSFACSPA